jgi:hypothetical protein
VSAYAEDEILGRPHNIVRHPDTPRCIFALLWETIQRGNELFAYVLNLAGDGTHYWVLAHVTPSVDLSGRPVGYHSNRRAPDPHAVREIAGVYQTLRRTERAEPRPAEAIRASRKHFETVLAARRQTYDEFVWSLAGGSDQ